MPNTWMDVLMTLHVIEMEPPNTLVIVKVLGVMTVQSTRGPTVSVVFHESSIEGGFFDVGAWNEAPATLLLLHLLDTDA